MNDFINDLVFVILVVVVNSISLTFFILFQFNVCHGVATLTSFIISICIFFLEFAIKRQNTKTATWIKYSLISFMTVGGAVGFLWFFYLIYRLFNFDGDTLNLLLNSTTAILSLGLAIHLIISAKRSYVQLTAVIEAASAKRVFTITDSREGLFENSTLP